MLKIIPFIYNNDPDELLANTYVLVDSDNSCLVVDPSKNNENIKNFIIKNNYCLKAVLLTHGHFDHFGGAEILLNYFKVPLYIGYEDEKMLLDPSMNCSKYIKESYCLETKVENYPNNGQLSLLNEVVEVIPTPYHTKGSVCFFLKQNGVVLSGDLIFKHTIGRDDLPNNSRKDKNESLSKILSLPAEVKIYPGHGQFTTVLEEQNTNNFVK